MIVSQHEINPKVLEHIEANRGLLTPDFSSYANERKRAWIGCEGPLSFNRDFELAPFSYESILWQWLSWFCRTNLDFEPELALLHVGGADCSDPTDNPLNGPGGECGIKSHRDAAYADYRAVGINLVGKATFGYRAVYPKIGSWSPKTNDTAPIEHVHMVAGTCVQFNCKNPHFAEVGPNRWAINAWRVSDRRRDDYLRFLAREGLTHP